MSNFASSTPISKQVDTDKLLHEWELNLLLGNVKKSIELWFLTGIHPKSGRAVSISYDQIMAACVEILKHDFMPTQTSTISNVGVRKRILDKLHDDFEWLRRSLQMRDSQFMKSSNSSHEITTTTTPSSKLTYRPEQNSVDYFLENWTLCNLQGNSLCAALQTFICEKDLLEHYYPKTSAFMRHESYATAFLICLSALELNQYSLLSQIDEKLYASPVRLNKENAMRHRRTNSHPNFSISPPKHHRYKENLNEIDKQTSRTITVTPPTTIIRKQLTFRKIKSLPELHTLSTSVTNKFDNLPRQRSKTLASVQKIKFHKNNKIQISNKSAKAEIPTLITTTTTTTKTMSDHNNLQSASNSTLDTDFSIKESLSCASSLLSSAQSDDTAHSSSNSYTTARKILLINCDDIKIWTDKNWEIEQKQKEKKLKPNITSPCDIPQGTKNTSPIHSFLSSIFSTSSANNSWSEQASCIQSSTHNLTVREAQSNIDVTNTSSSSNKINNYNNNSDCFNYVEEVPRGSVFDTFMPVYGKKLRKHNSQSLFETGISYLDYSQPSGSNSVGMATAAASSNASANVSGNEVTSTKPNKNCESLTAYLQMSKLSRNNTALEKENAHFRISEAIISAVEHVKWAKLQAGQNKSINPPANNIEEHIPFAEVNGVEEFADQHSAEVVGLTLLSKFNDKQLPKVSELKWLVSEEDAPQQLLPMPEPSNNPDDHFVPSLTRGTRYWAPPRPQIIFTDHPPPNRKKLVQKQNNRCAGCGMVVSNQYVHSFRYCTYLGKYHCTGCHRNQMSITPAKILQNWDFKCYPVSVFAYRLLEQMYTCPLFHVPDLNSTLYGKHCSLRVARQKRLHLHYVRDFINTCRFATREQQYFESVPSYLTAEPDLWSMSDLNDAYTKVMPRSIDDLIERCENHIFHCILCTARGFMCEHCQKDEIIYPWKKRVHRCDNCGTCFHEKCWTSGMSGQCLRCQRLQKRSPENGTTK